MEKSCSRAQLGRCYCASTACALVKDHKITQAVHQVYLYDIQILNCSLRHTWEINTDLLYLGNSSKSPSYFSVWFRLPDFFLKTRHHSNILLTRFYRKRKSCNNFLLTLFFQRDIEINHQPAGVRTLSFFLGLQFMGFTAGVTQHGIIKYSELKGTHKDHLAICCQKTPSPNELK